MAHKRRDLVVIPYHDWRKVQREGARTRDAHMILHCLSHPGMGRVVIVNRPMTVGEMICKRRSWRTEGEVVAAGRSSRLVKIAENGFALDLFDEDPLGPVFSKKNWFLSAYGKGRYAREIEKYLSYLDVTEFSCISFNVLAAALLGRLDADRKLFDAWDNFLRFPEHANNGHRLREAYTLCSRVADVWSTNSLSNKSFYEANFGVAGCRVIRNGVDPEVFSREYDMPEDLRDISRPVAGVGAKVTHLIDHDLTNYVVEANPDVSFVLVGPVIERAVFRRIVRRPNFFYLGDKHYDQYPAYVKAFDVCLIPYAVGEKEHGGDAIKLYEYLAAGKPTVTTRIEGVTDRHGNVFVADSCEEFSEMIRRALSSPPRVKHLPERFTWRHRARQLLEPLVG